jgi:hypothetical protein
VITDEPASSRVPVQWWSRTAIKLHATLLGGLTMCAIASWIEWRRALDGRAIAWVYAFEWPLFAVLGTYAWWRLVHDDQPRRRRPRPSRRPQIPDDDPGLAAWRSYLAELESGQTPDPPAR